VVPNTAFGQPTMAVDTQIFRVANRYRTSLSGTTLRPPWRRKLLKSVPTQFLQDAHHLADPARTLRLQGRASPIARPAPSPICAADRRKTRAERREASPIMFCDRSAP
jgi:endonuclease III